MKIRISRATDGFLFFPYPPDHSNGRTNNGGIDLVRRPERIEEITELSELPGLRRLLTQLNSGIDYVTPHQAHAGLRGEIVARRLSQQHAQRLRRRAANQRQSDPKQTPKPNPTAVALVV